MHAGHYARLETSKTVSRREKILPQGKALLEQAVADNQRALDLTQTSYRVGQSDLRAVQQQLLSLQSARQTLLRVESERLSQRTVQHLALGGSFESPPSE